MKNKRVLAKGNKIVLFLIQQIVAVIAAVCIVTASAGSMLNISSEFQRYNFFLNPFEYDMEFEETDVFNTMLEKGIRDAVRMSVIKSQLETDGEFDGNKKIDVTAYVNRAEQLSGSYVTANYRLEDLLKWGKYGLEYTGKVFDTRQEMNAFLASKTTYTQYEGTYTTGFHPIKGEEESANVMYWELPEQTRAELEATYTETESESVAEVGKSQGNYQTILSSRYKTVDNHTPQELVSTWQEYYELCDNIAEAANSLYYNYQEYLNYENYYSLENSNLLYCMEMLVDGENVFFTNATLTDFEEKTISDYFTKFNKNIYYSPYDMAYYTSTNISEDYFLQLMNEYNYAYTENTKIWIAVDDKYPAQDVFAQVEYVYNNFLPYWWQYVGGAIACVAIYFLLLVVQAIYTGRVEVFDEEAEEVDEEWEEEEAATVQLCVSKFEQIPTEIWMVICGIAAGLMFTMIWFTFDMLAWKSFDSQVVLRVAAIETVLVSSVGCLLFLSLVRRWKVHNLWKESFTYHILRWLYRKVLLTGVEVIKTVYWNFPVALRTLVPYGLLMGVNVFVLMFAFISEAVVMLVLLIVADAVVGWILFKNSVDKKKIVDGIGEIRNGDLNYQVDTTKLYGENRILAEAVNSIGDGIRTAVETSMKDERLKADLITNVSHDIKTPLTSIINYVDLLKREDIQDEKVKSYIQVLDNKSQRLKQLTDDLVEASKISSGNITLHIERINIVELLNQAIGEFSEKFETKDLQMVVTFDSKAMYIDADSRRMWRVIENLFNNIYKYAMPGTRVYIDGKEEKNGKDSDVVLNVKNISAQPLNINADELTERFIRGDVSRSTEGSGLGLSIAKNLTEAQNGKFHIYLDGDLFKAIIRFPKAEERRD